jgi:cytochrome P450
MGQGPRPIGTSPDEQARNQAFGAGVVDDPYPVLRDVRRQCPVGEGSVASVFPEMARLGQSMAPDGPTTLAAYSHDAVMEVLRNCDHFSSAEFYAPLSSAIGHSILGMDEPEHRRMRLLVQSAFSKREMERWRPAIIEPVVDEHFDRIVGWGRCELQAEIGATIPVHTIAAAIGLPRSERGRFFDLGVTMTSPVVSQEARLAAAAALGDYVAPLVEQRRREHTDDLIGVLVNARVPPEVARSGLDERPLSDEEIATFVRVLVVAGSATTYRAYGVLLFHLLTNTEQLAQVRADPSLRHNAIEEAIRIDQPLATIGRVAVADTEVQGVTIPAGSRVDLSIGAANHDSEQWVDPDRFDIHRDRVDRHLSFGFGVHRCLGVHLARAELEVMLDRTLTRLPGLRLDPTAKDVYITGVGLRVVSRLPALYDVT